MTSYTEDHIETITDFISRIIEAPPGSEPLPVRFNARGLGLGVYPVTVREASS